jgi:hypothetical protein
MAQILDNIIFYYPHVFFIIIKSIEKVKHCKYHIFPSLYYAQGVRK